MGISDKSQAKQDQWVAPQGPALAEQLTDMRTARDRAAGFLHDRASRPGVLGRRIMGRPGPRDAQLADQLIRERRRHTRIDGSMDGMLLRTAWTAWELMDLGCPTDHSAVLRTIGFVLSKQDRPGYFAEGCTAERHAERLCRHFVSGFFSAGTPDEDVGPLEFPTGLVVNDEEAARFAASCFTLRVVLRAQQDCRSAVCQHVESLLAMDQLWESLGSRWPSDLTFFALGGVALAPLQYRERIDEIVSGIVEQQLPDGTWPNSHFFNALEMLMSASTPATRVALKRAAPLLRSMQSESGAFDPTDNEEIAFIGLRALRMAEK